jgi:hypothetical protein
MNEFTINITLANMPQTPYSAGEYNLDKIGVTTNGRNIKITLLTDSFNVLTINGEPFIFDII